MDESQKSNSKDLLPKRNSDGKWPADLTPEQVALMSNSDAADYMEQLFIDGLNAGVLKDRSS